MAVVKMFVQWLDHELVQNMLEWHVYVKPYIDYIIYGFSYIAWVVKIPYGQVDFQKFSHSNISGYIYSYGTLTNSS